MTSSLIFDIPEYKRYAIPLAIVLTHKITTLEAEGTEWDTVPAEEYTANSLIDWFMSKMTFADVLQFMQPITSNPVDTTDKIIPITVTDIAG